MGRADELIAAGEEAALSNIERIRQLLEPAPEPAAKWYQRFRRPATQPREKSGRASTKR
jgi:hypothetical protein